MNPYVKSVQPRDDYLLILTFESGEKRVFDMKPYLDRPVFASLRNASLFKTARVVSGSVEWQGEIDLSYDTLYLESKPLKTKPSRRKSVRGRGSDVAAAAVDKKKPPKARAAVKQ
jgi:hypothetical protein